MREVEDDIAKTKIEIKDEIKMNMTGNEMTTHSNAWLTHLELSYSLMKSRGMVNPLLLGVHTGASG